MKKGAKMAVASLVIIFLVLAIRFVFGGPEDDWICQEGTWVKHGNPSKPMPIISCKNFE